MRVNSEMMTVLLCVVCFFEKHFFENLKFRTAGAVLERCMCPKLTQILENTDSKSFVHNFFTVL